MHPTTQPDIDKTQGTQTVTHRSWMLVALHSNREQATFVLFTDPVEVREAFDTATRLCTQPGETVRVVQQTIFDDHTTRTDVLAAYTHPAP